MSGKNNNFPDDRLKSSYGGSESPRGEGKISEDKEVYSPGKKVLRRFFRHRLGVVSTAVIIFILLLIIFAGFVSPYNMATRREDLTHVSPTRIRLFHEGEFQGRPFVYGLERERDPVTLRINYTENKDEMYPIKLFTRGESYKFLGLFETDLHLFGLGPEADGHLFLFGTDRLGRCFFSRTLYGGRTSVSIAFLGVMFSFFIGIFMGGISGYYGGAVDNVIQRMIEVIRSFPRVPLWLALSVIVPARWPAIMHYIGLIFILTIISWTGVARVVRGQIFSIKEKEFVEAARAVGAKDMRVIFRHILPNCMSYVIVAATLSFPGLILAESAISFLGLGIQEPMASWGLLLEQAQRISVIRSQPWLLIPGAFIIVTVLAFNFFGDAFRDAIDPYAMD